MEQISIHPADHGQNIHVLDGCCDGWHLLEPQKKPHHMAIAVGSSRLQDLIQTGPGLQAAINNESSQPVLTSSMFSVRHMCQVWLAAGDECMHPMI